MPTRPQGPKRVPSLELMEAAPLRCHAFGHPWEKPPAVPFNYYGFRCLLLVFRCPSCGTVRRDVRDWVKRRELVTRIYQHADGYLAGFSCSVQEYVEEWLARYNVPPDDVEGDWWEWAA